MSGVTKTTSSFSDSIEALTGLRCYYTHGYITLIAAKGCKAKSNKEKTMGHNMAETRHRLSRVLSQERCKRCP